MTDTVQELVEVEEGFCHCGCGLTTKLAQQTSARAGYTKGQPQRFLNGHAGRISLQERLDRHSTPEPMSGCVLWIGALTGNGYGIIYDARLRRKAPAHRASYEAARGPIPEGLDIDHLCRVRSCINPRHLEAVTTSVNLRRGIGFIGINARKTQCPAGHPYSEANTYINPRGERKCRACDRERYYRTMADPEAHERLKARDRARRRRKLETAHA